MRWDERPQSSAVGSQCAIIGRAAGRFATIDIGGSFSLKAGQCPQGEGDGGRNACARYAGGIAHWMGCDGMSGTAAAEIDNICQAAIRQPTIARAIRSDLRSLRRTPVMARNCAQVRPAKSAAKSAAGCDIGGTTAAAEIGAVGTTAAE